MKTDTGFWIGMGAGLVVGMMVGKTLCHDKCPMKTQVGRGIEKLGVAVDRKVDSVISNLR
jgi:hypothetical protein